MFRSLLSYSLVFATLGALAPAASADAPAPPPAPEDAYPALTWAEVEAAMKTGAVLVDARSADQFQAGHIAGAINVPTGDDAALARLPADKATQLVFYCGGPACRARTNCAAKVQALGFTKLAQYKGGYPEWRAAHPD